MRIGITDNKKPEKFDLYIRWLKRSEPELEVVKLSYAADNLRELDRCDGLVLTGGGDVDPVLYRQEGNPNLIQDVDRKRDDFEFRVIDSATRHAIPMLGICRGLQITNVVFGGSLFVDLESKGYTAHRQAGEEENRHPIQIVSGSQLSTIIGSNSGEVNSAHHQAANDVGSNLKASAFSPDGVIEALEWVDPAGKPFLLLVQWHPERMKHFENRCSKSILQKFLFEVRNSVEA